MTGGDGDSSAGGDPERRGFTRRGALIGAASAGALAGLGIEAALSGGDERDGWSERRREAYDIRVAAAREQAGAAVEASAGNGDETRYPDRAGSYSKGLPHDGDGLVDPRAYDALLRSLEGDAPLASVPLGGARRLVNPTAARAYSLEGPDPQTPELPPAPPLASPEMAAELAELYWWSLLRDVPFQRFGTDALVAEAAADLGRMRGYTAAAGSSRLTPAKLLRGDAAGDLHGPYVSQFLLKPIPSGSLEVAQRHVVPAHGDDHLAGYRKWLAMQRGGEPDRDARIDAEKRYVRNGRDLAEAVHRDYLFQPALEAALILFAYDPPPLDQANPYFRDAVEEGFVTFGRPHALDLTVRVAHAAFKACWFQKWLVHRRVRPEEIAGRLHAKGRAGLNVHRDLERTMVADRIAARNGNWMLSQAYPEGSPLHPAYPSGHAVAAGATMTVLKAFFDESFILPDPVVPSEDGLSLERLEGVDLTVGGELNKLASNVSIGRCAAGIHWRSDAVDGILLGEAVAIGVLADQARTLPESDFQGFSLRRFDGRHETVMAAQA